MGVPDYNQLYLGFSAAAPTLAAMTGAVQPQPATFLSSFFFGGTPPSVSSAVLSGFAAAEMGLMSAIDQLLSGQSVSQLFSQPCSWHVCEASLCPGTYRSLSPVSCCCVNSALGISGSA